MSEIIMYKMKKLQIDKKFSQFMYFIWISFVKIFDDFPEIDI